MEPTMGRIVLYTPSDPNDTSALGAQAPAIVSRVKDGLVCLTVFPPELAPYSVTGVAEAQSGASEPGTWCWPPAAPTGSAPEAAEPEKSEAEAGGADNGGGGTVDQGGGQTGEPATTTSAASEKPLYTIAGEEVPHGFSASGLETPEGAALFHWEGDTAGQTHTFDVGSVADVALYAEADDNSQPVKPATAEQPVS